MSFNVGTLLAKLKLDSKGFDDGVKKSTKGTTVLAGALKGLATVAMAKLTFEAAKAGGQLIDLERAFNRMARSANTTGATVIREARAITGALTNREIMNAANTLEVMGLGMQNLPRFMEIAKAASIAFGKDMNFMLDSLVVGTARQSKLILDNLGIMIEGTVTTAKVMEAGQQIIDRVGASAESAAEPMAAFSTELANVRQELEKIAAITVGPLLEGIMWRINFHRATRKKAGGMAFPTGGTIGKGTPISDLLRPGSSLQNFSGQLRHNQPGLTTVNDHVFARSRELGLPGARGARTAGRGGRPFAG